MNSCSVVHHPYIPADSEKVFVRSKKKLIMDLQIWAQNSVLVADREPSRSGAVARLRGRPPPPPPPPSAQVTGSDPGTDRESSPALNGPTYATYTTDTCTPPQLLHLFYD